MKRVNIYFIVLFLTIIPVLLPLLKPGYFPTQDFIHVPRFEQMEKAFWDGQFPVRWVPDFRYGDPTFNFYAPLPYYAGLPFRMLGFGYLDTIKILFGLGFILAGYSMFYLGKKFFSPAGGLVSAIFYTYAPYHSVDVYVRGALSESWALIFLPLIFLSSFNLKEKLSLKNIALTAASLTGLFYTHNVMTMLFAPFLIAWFAILLLTSIKRKKLLIYLASAFILAIALSASFLLPAYFEKEFVRSEELTTGYFDFRGHFVAIKQWVIPFWGYGASLWGDEDGMSFQIGIVHLILFLLSLVFLLIKRNWQLALFLTLSVTFSLLMQHNRSAPIWEAFPLLAFTQFPWRFLGVTIFLISFAAGTVAIFLPKKLLPLAIFPILAVIIVNLQFFQPQSYYLDSIDSHYSGEKILSQDDKIPKDYLPIWAKPLFDKKNTQPIAKSGQIEVRNFQKRSDSVSFNIIVLQEADIEVPITYFPGWEVFLDGKKQTQEDPSDLGLIRFRKSPGDYQVKVQFNNTPIRTVANILTIFAVAVTVLLFKLKDEKF